LHAVIGTPIKKYRPWGDELFFSQKHIKAANGGDSVTLPYPTTAPPLPPEFQGLLLA
jgi:hypothetical protein